MKKIILIAFLFTATIINAQEKKVPTISQTVEASCGQCKFGMTSKKGCDLAIRIDNKTYFVDGVNMNSQGDAHGHDGMCNVVRKAQVVGTIKDDRFIASSFKLLPMEGEKHDEHDGHKH